MNNSNNRRNLVIGRNSLVIRVYGVIIIFGIFFCVIKNEICNGIGCSLIASAIVSLILFYFLSSAEERYDFHGDWGLEKIYASRRIPINKKNFPQKHLDIIAFGLSSFVRANQDIEYIASLIRNGLRIKIITVHPNSFYVDRQKEFENRNEDLRKNINELHEWVNSIKQYLPESEYNKRIKIKFYNNLPLFFYCKADNCIYTGQYFPDLSSSEAFTYKYNAMGKAGKWYGDMFNKIWKSGHKKPVVYVPYDKPLINSDVKKSIENILQYFSHLIINDIGSVVGIVVIFKTKNKMRRTFYSCNKGPNHESHQVYSIDKGAFGEFRRLNVDNWVSDKQHALIFKDYENKQYVVKSIDARTGESIIRCPFREDVETMNSSINAVLIAPLIRDRALIGAITFDFVRFDDNYRKAVSSLDDLGDSPKPLHGDYKNIMTEWFGHAEVSARMINHFIGNPNHLDFDALYDEEWKEKSI